MRVKRLQLAFGDESPRRATVFRWYSEFCTGQDEENTGRSRLAHQKEERVRISKETLKLLNDGSHRLTSKIVADDEMYIPYFDVPTRQECKVWVFEDEGQKRMVWTPVASVLF
ncbi:uncharacterized protein TNCV_3376541 [Trichonephila clavipes]|nr:uncharacterized protein TNCV_3376541 [Trichonephila clavipes]